MAAVVVERVRELRAPRHAIWSLIADTERLNEAIGLDPLEIASHDDDSAVRYVVRTLAGGLPIEYGERPFEWVEDEWFSVARIVRKGAIDRIEHAFRLEPRFEDGVETGTRLTMRATIVPKLALLAPLVRLQTLRLAQRLLDQLERIDAALADGEEAAFECRPPQVDEAALRRLGAELAARLPPERRALAERLLRYLAQASDVAVSRIRPFVLAEQWRVDRDALLSCCLHGVMAGVLELQWDLLCPSCHTSADRVAALGELERESYCQLCDIAFGVELDRAVEATFQPTSVVRKAQLGPYCLGGPMATPHVVIQLILAPQAAITVPAPDKPGRYRVFVRGGITAELEVDTDAKPELALVIDDAAVRPSRARVAPGGRLRVRHDSARERHLKIERAELIERAATAQLLSTMPEFRRLFARQLLRPGMSLSVGRIALVFTDLKDSTALYREIGDARAFRLVQDHFDALFPVVERHQGAVVKLMGDAIMAAFAHERDALQAAFAMLRAFETLQAGNVDAARSGLKVGVHVGPCYAVTANGVFDYFGQHVNLAARLQGLADAGQVVMAQALADEALAHDWLSGARELERLVADLKGIGEAVPAVRFALANAATG